MTDELECLICGRPAKATGEPDCTCLTHTLSRPVSPSETGPDPADVALFPVEPAPAQPPLRGASAPVSHRKPRQRARFAVVASGSLTAAAVGCAALAASLLSGQGRSDQALDDDRLGPSVALPDGGYGSGSPEDGNDADSPGNGEDDEDGGARGGRERQATPPPRGDETLRPESPTPPEPGPPPSPTPAPSASPSPSPTPEPSSAEPSTGPTGTSTPTGTPSSSPSTLVSSTPGEGAALREGDEGPEVVELQQRLLQLHWIYVGEAHGVFDAATREAVARFQVAYGVRGDPEGVYGPHTRRVLERHTELPVV